MDPASFAMLMKALEPALGLLALAVLPIGIIWARSVYKMRMRELDLEDKMSPDRFEARLTLIEARLASIEAAVGAPAHAGVQERAALLEGPATWGQAETPPLVRPRER